MSNMQGQWEMIHTGSRRQKYAMIFVQEHFLLRSSTLFGKIICLFNSTYTVIGNRSRDHFNAKSFVIGHTNSYIRKCKRDFNAVQESSEHGVLWPGQRAFTVTVLPGLTSPNATPYTYLH